MPNDIIGKILTKVRFFAHICKGWGVKTRNFVAFRRNVCICVIFFVPLPPKCVWSCLVCRYYMTCPTISTRPIERDLICQDFYHKVEVIGV